MKRHTNDSLLRKTLVFFGLIVIGIWSVKAFGQQGPQANAAPTDGQNLVGPEAQGPRCLPVQGLTFTISGPETLLATKGQESVALIHTTMFLPAGMHELRFLASDLCPGGPKAHFVVNHYLHTVQELRFFDGPGTEHVAVIGPTGRQATVPVR
jgi:hypothetical protein